MILEKSKNYRNKDKDPFVFKQKLGEKRLEEAVQNRALHALPSYSNALYPRATDWPGRARVPGNKRCQAKAVQKRSLEQRRTVWVTLITKRNETLRRKRGANRHEANRNATNRHGTTRTETISPFSLEVANKEEKPSGLT